MIAALYLDIKTVASALFEDGASTVLHAMLASCEQSGKILKTISIMSMHHTPTLGKA
jgi:hypothetical protein